MACWQDFEWVTLAMMPMFLFFATLFPLGRLPPWLQLFVESTRLYQGIEIVRGLLLGTVAPALLGRVRTERSDSGVRVAVTCPTHPPPRRSARARSTSASHVPGQLRHARVSASNSPLSRLCGS